MGGGGGFWEFSLVAKSRVGTLVTRAYVEEKNLDLLEQGPRGISR